MNILNSNTSGKLASNALAKLSKATCLFTLKKISTQMVAIVPRGKFE